MVRSSLLRLGALAIVFATPLMVVPSVMAIGADDPSSWLMARPIIPELPDDDGGNHSNNDDREHRRDRDRYDWDRRAQEYCDDLESRRDRQECREDWEDRHDDWERRRDQDDLNDIFEDIFN